ncbi:MAG: YdcF family protein [Micropruina sp.]|uniref:YdcF family protein n=1 Tax=Micropruina sp. TaxID=2737536 RepID=UPI0039E5EE74
MTTPVGLVGRVCRDLSCALLALWLAAEAVHRAAERYDAPTTSGAETLLVLGYPSDKHGRPSPLQRWRVDLAARNARPDTRFVMTGANEAGVMAADLIARHGIDPARITLENEATSTWENIGNSAPLIAPGGVVRIVSDPLHARRAERYWRLRHPERAGELRAARLYRFGEHPLLKLATAAYTLVLRGMRYRPDGRIWRRASAAR